MVVTGAGSGIGQATARALAERGARVVVVDRDSVAAELTATAVGGTSIVVDVRDPGHAEAVVAGALSHYQRLDAIIANAGVGYDGQFAAMPVAQIHALLDVNLRAPMLLARAALPVMTAQGTTGALVFTTSIAGVVPVPGEAAYCLSKTALESFADALREELRSTRITVSTVRPGVVRTAFHTSRNDPYDRRWPRPMAPEKVAEAVVDVLTTGAEHRTIPRWLSVAGYARRSVPWLYRALARRLG